MVQPGNCRGTTIRDIDRFQLPVNAADLEDNGKSLKVRPHYEQESESLASISSGSPS